MTNYIPQHYAAATLFRIGECLHGTARMLRIAAEQLDRLIAARRKATDDRRVLSEMSPRELRDIGVGDAYGYALRSANSRCGHEALRAIDWRHPM